MTRLFLFLLVFAAPALAQTSPLVDVRVLNANLGLNTVLSAAPGAVAFLDYRAGAYGIYRQDVGSGAERLLASPAYAEPDVSTSDRRVSWIGYTTGSAQADVYAYDLQALTTRRITNDAAYQNHAVTSGSLVVWQDYRNAGSTGTNADIYYFDFNTNATLPVTTAAGYQDLPAVYGRRVVWQDFRNAGSTGATSDIYAKDLDTGVERRLTTGAFYRTSPALYENLVVWEDYRNGTRGDIYLYDLSTGVERAISTFPAHKENPLISGTWIVWLDYRNGGTTADLYGFNLATNTEYLLLVDGAHQDAPALSADRLTWQDYRNGRLDLYTGRLSFPTAAEEPVRAGTTVHAFPNPSSGPVTLQGLRGAFRVFDAVGRLVYHGDAAPSGTALWGGADTAGLRVPPGLYFVRADQGGPAIQLLRIR